MTRTPALLFALPACLLAGCGGSGLHPVRGTVVYADGTPVQAGMVVVERADGGDGQRHSASGAIQKDGTFRLTTETPDDGVPAGRYRAVVMSPPLSDDQRGRGEKPLIDARFAEFGTSGLEIEVRPGGAEVTFTVARPAKR